MKITDLTSDYIQHVCADNNFELYENNCPELFEHYYTYWSKKNSSKVFIKAEIIYSRDLILSILPHIKKSFLKLDIDVSDLTIILFVGMGNTNGHAFRYKDQFVVWIPVETYKNEIDTNIFITHEIAHALHYKNSPDLYFNSKKEQKHIGRQLVTEGVATYISKLVLGSSDEESLWGNYLDKVSLDKWMNNCDLEFDSIKKLLYDNFNSSDDSLGLFYANDKNDIFNFRCGYYAGLKLVEQIIKSQKFSLAGLLKHPRDRFEKEILLFLK